MELQNNRVKIKNPLEKVSEKAGMQYILAEVYFYSYWSQRS